MAALPTPCLMLVTEPHVKLPEIVSDAISGGVNVVQWRDKTTPLGMLKTQASAVRAAVISPAQLIVNGSLEIGTLAHANGIQLPGTSVSISEARQILGPDKLIGRSVHSVAEAIAAAQDGVDYLIVGTIFASQSHPEIAPSGVELLQEISRVVDVPLIAIGGITPDRVRTCLEAGASGVAVLSPIMRAGNPRQVAQDYWKEMQGSPPPDFPSPRVSQ